MIFFHIYADGDWEQPTQEFLDAADPSEMLVGVVGSAGNLLAVRQWFKMRPHIEATIIAYHPEGWEHITLEFLRDYAHSASPDEPILYAHTKGAANPSDLNTTWRRSMLNHVVAPWRFHVQALKTFDTIGERWLRTAFGGTGFWAGNFWIARASYLTTLPPLDYTNRYMAEVWIGQGHPKVLDLNPGWPTLANCGEHL